MNSAKQTRTFQIKIVVRNIIIILVAFLASCEKKDDEPTSTPSETSAATDIDLVTGITLRNSNTPGTELGNPNVFIDNQFVAYPNPPDERLFIQASEEISDVWFVPATAEKKYQDTNFDELLDVTTYSEEFIDSNAEFIVPNQNNPLVNLAITDLPIGYYRLFVRIDGEIYWDNIYIPEDGFDATDLVEFWE